ncbi:MAG: OsmC family protein, partial [Actinomycetota bacterium]
SPAVSTSSPEALQDPTGVLVEGGLDNDEPAALAVAERSENTMSTIEQTSGNGVNVEALLGARDALTAAPEAAQFQWKANAQWVNGTHTKTTVEKFFGLGAEQTHNEAFVLDTDHPEIFAATDQGVTPVEMVLGGLAGCLTAGVATVATNRGIELRSVSATLEGDMDLQGILGIDPDVRNGFAGIKVTYTIDADATDDEVRGLVAQSQKRSAVYDIIANPTNVVVEVA